MKDVNYLFLACLHWFNNGFTSKTILVYPHYPSRRSTIYLIAKKLHYNITNKPAKGFDFALYWEYLTFREEYAYLEGIVHKKRVINLYSRDISKEAVDRAFKTVFGYSSFIDPLTHKGKFVKKNDINAIHDGTIVEGPVEHVEAGFVYQKLINNTSVDGSMVVDIRVPVIFGTLSFVYEKFKPVDDRFGHPAKSVVRHIHDMLTEEEIHNINRFCEHMKLEFGEMDVLRDTDTGNIYVIDVNNTPQFQSKLSPSDRNYALHEMGEVLENNTHEYL